MTNTPAESAESAESAEYGPRYGLHYGPREPRARYTMYPDGRLVDNFLNGIYDPPPSTSDEICALPYRPLHRTDPYFYGIEFHTTQPQPRKRKEEHMKIEEHIQAVLAQQIYEIAEAAESILMTEESKPTDEENVRTLMIMYGFWLKSVSCWADGPQHKPHSVAEYSAKKLQEFIAHRSGLRDNDPTAKPANNHKRAGVFIGRLGKLYDLDFNEIMAGAGLY